MRLLRAAAVACLAVASLRGATADVQQLVIDTLDLADVDTVLQPAPLSCGRLPRAKAKCFAHAPGI